MALCCCIERAATRKKRRCRRFGFARGRRDGGLFALALAGPDSSRILGFLPLVVARVISQHRQGALVAEHFGFGGKKGSSWAAAGIGLACLSLVLVVLFFCFFVWAVATGAE